MVVIAGGEMLLQCSPRLHAEAVLGSWPGPAVDEEGVSIAGVGSGYSAVR